MSGRSCFKAKKVAFFISNYLLIVLVLILALLPVFWLVVTSIKPAGEITTKVPIFIPSKPTLTNYRGVFFPEAESLYQKAGVAREMLSVTGWVGVKNSIIVTLLSTALAIGIGLMAAYAFSRLRFKGRDTLAFWLLSTKMFPPATVILPIFIMMNRLRLVDTQVALILVYLVFNLPFSVWMLRGFFMEVPRELDECAMVDGCGHLGALVRIILPLLVPGIIVTAIFCFIFSWNEFFFALILTRVKAQTFPVQVSAFLGVKGIQWGPMAAFGVAGSIPPLVLAIAAQRYLVRGLTYGAVKE